jgi:hypothetical protein
MCHEVKKPETIAEIIARSESQGIPVSVHVPPGMNLVATSGERDFLKTDGGDRRYFVVPDGSGEPGPDPSNPAATVPIEIVVEERRESVDLHASVFRAPAVVAQPAPKGDGPIVVDALIADLEKRKRFGIAKYGTPLRTKNGRKMLVDALQEAIDLVVYLKGEIMEREGLDDEIRALRGEVETYRKIARESVAQVNAIRAAVVDVAQENEREGERTQFIDPPEAHAVRGWIAEEIRKILGREAPSFSIVAKLKAWRAELDAEPAGGLLPDVERSRVRVSNRIGSILGEDVLP